MIQQQNRYCECRELFMNTLLFSISFSNINIAPPLTSKKWHNLKIKFQKKEKLFFNLVKITD